jgi:topoisomerase IV subunit B
MSDLFESSSTSSSSYSAKDIEVLEGLEPVRLRPGMYIGGTDDRALHHLVAELLDNAMDEAVAGHASRIGVGLDKHGYVTISDNGRGIPVDPHPKYKDKSALEVILTTLHSGGKFSGKAYATSGGLHGVGISVVNALCLDMEIEVARDKQLWSQKFSQGKATTKLLSKGPIQNRRGTTVRFNQDPEIFGEKARFNPMTVFKMARSKAYLHRGVEIRWSCDSELLTDVKDVPTEATIHFPGGLADYLSTRMEGVEQLTDGIFSGQVEFPEGEGRMEWAVAWPAEGETFVSSYCNTIPTPLGGTHESGLRIGLSRSIKSYAELLGNKKSSIVTPDDVMSSCSVVLSIFIREPQFQGQTKERLTSSSVNRLVESASKDHFDLWLSSNPQVGKMIIDSIVMRAEERLRRRQEKEMTRKTATRKLRLPGKLADCSRNSSIGTELFMVEGDSAGGSAKQARFRETQAILPLRGKILNVASATADKMRANQELTDLVQALGCGVGKTLNVEKLRYERVIIMTDADVDGAHIASLLMTFFYREMRGLIEEGKLYLAMPPLYRLSQGAKTAYARDDAHRVELEDTYFDGRGKVDVSRFKGLGEMAPSQLKETTMDPKSRTLLRISIEDIEDMGLADPTVETAEVVVNKKQEAILRTNEIVDDLMGKKPEKRFAFIQENAAFVQDLDI